ncbi:hypothetical protein Goshw_010981 [Gossypium schwendimanii]|uniref:Uncharacterized protein n=1 Tax=Gossypium schwendimanii TaxID=34291 RepID=A0A7J9LVK3_GOSSC|nr:hypothetical protein [Gossypium schwendimanii]
MAMVLAMVVHGMGLLVKTLWGVQERRFSATFETLRSAAISMTTAYRKQEVSMKPETGYGYTKQEVSMERETCYGYRNQVVSLVP